MSDTTNLRKYYINICRPLNPAPGCDRHASVCQTKYIQDQVTAGKQTAVVYLFALLFICSALCVLTFFLLKTASFSKKRCSCTTCGQILDVSPPSCPQGLPKEVVSVSNMGVSKRGPIIEGRDRLLLEFTDGSVCMSDGLQLKYTTRIHLVCSRGSQVSPADPGGLGGLNWSRRLSVGLRLFVLLSAVHAPAVPDVPELHCQLQVGDQGGLCHHHHQERREFTTATSSCVNQKVVWLGNGCECVFVL